MIWRMKRKVKDMRVEMELGHLHATLSGQHGWFLILSSFERRLALWNFAVLSGEEKPLKFSAKGPFPRFFSFDFSSYCSPWNWLSITLKQSLKLITTYQTSMSFPSTRLLLILQTVLLHSRDSTIADQKVFFETDISPTFFLACSNIGLGSRESSCWSIHFYTLSLWWWFDTSIRKISVYLIPVMWKLSSHDYFVLLRPQRCSRNQTRV
jgi:hypothetical protein